MEQGSTESKLLEAYPRLTPEMIRLAPVYAQAYPLRHVAHVGKADWKDWHVMQHAREQDFVLVTNNAVDFRQLYAAQAPHAGLANPSIRFSR